MPKKLYLHIGSPKTGTTSIQQAFAANRPALETQGFCYPGDDICHHWLYFITEQDQDRWPRQFKGQPASGIQRGFRQHLRAIDRDLGKDISRYLLSSEYFFIDDPQAIARALQFLGNFFDEIEVIAFVRCPVSFYASSQQQVIKASSRLTPPWEFHYKFRSVIQAWEDQAKMTVLGHRPESDSLATLCAHLGVNSHQLAHPAGMQNQSLSVEHMLMLEKLQQRIYPDQDNLFKPHLGLIQQVKMPSLTKPVLRDDVQALIQARHVDDLEWLKHTHGVDVADHRQARTEIDVDRLKASLGNAPTVGDLYLADFEKAAHFEAALMDELLKAAANGQSSASGTREPTRERVAR